MKKKHVWESRHTVLLILSMTWFISFMDRKAMAIVIIDIAKEYDLSALAIGAIMSAASISYSVSQIPSGFLVDRFHVRNVAAIALLWWSAFAMITSSANSFIQLLIARLGFGLGGGALPIFAFKAIALWFPREDRATANAIIFAAGRIGTAIAPFIVVLIMFFLGWRAVFFCFGSLGVLMALLCWKFVPHKLSAKEDISSPRLAKTLETDTEIECSSETKVEIFTVLRTPIMAKCILVLFAYDLAGWGVGAWLPVYLISERGFSMVQMGAAVSLPSLASIVGSVLGGWMSDKYFKNRRWVPIIGAQLTTALLIFLIFIVNSVVALVICQVLVGFCGGVFATSFWAIPMNTVSATLMGATSGIINTAGQIAAIVSPTLFGLLVGIMGGDYYLAFTFLIVSLLVSCIIVFVLPDETMRDHGEAVQR